MNCHYGGRQRTCIGTRLVNCDPYVKIKRWLSKGMQEKESITAVWFGKKNPSLEITVWHQSAKQEFSGIVVSRLDYCAGDLGSIPAGAEFPTVI